VDDDDLDPDVLLAAVIEAVADELPNRDADVIPLERDSERVEPA
jgi:hypothetical protein